MQIKNSRKKQLNTLLAAGFILLLLLIIGWRFDYFYALNDDMMMKDIMAGVFTGKPEGHNIQMLYPISFFISLFYYVGEHISWYGIFLSICHFGCLFLIAKRSLTFVNKAWSKAFVICMEGIFVFSFFLWEIVFMQYTVTSGLLAATAAFLFYTTDSAVTWKQYLQKNALSILLVIVAFMIRTEMLLLLFPLICTVGVFKWSEENPIFTKENAKKYGSVLGVMAAGMLAVFGINKLAYSSEEWNTFYEFFDARTQVYDFYNVPPYEGNEKFYTEIGLTEKEQELLVNYNFGLEEEIDEQLMGTIQNYAAQQWTSTHSLKENAAQAIWKYRNQDLTPENTALYQLVILAYFVLILVGLSNRKLAYLWKIPFLFAVRSGLWMYIIYRNRLPRRITHPLCIMELFIIAALLLKDLKKSKLSAVCVTCGFLIFGVFGIAQVGENCEQVKTEMTSREAVNEEYNMLLEYSKENPDHFYLFDVMSTVPYSEKVFKGVDNRFSNIGYLGGWVSKSPINSEKLRTAGFETEKQALAAGQNTYLVMRSLYNADWLNDYFKEEGITGKATLKGILYHKEAEAFHLYKVEKAED